MSNKSFVEFNQTNAYAVNTNCEGYRFKKPKYMRHIDVSPLNTEGFSKRDALPRLMGNTLNGVGAPCTRGAVESTGVGRAEAFGAEAKELQGCGPLVASVRGLRRVQGKQFVFRVPRLLELPPFFWGGRVERETKVPELFRHTLRLSPVGNQQGKSNGAKLKSR